MKCAFTIAPVLGTILLISSYSQGEQPNATSPETASSENIEQLLTNLGAEWSKVNLSHDTSALERILAPDLVYIADDPGHVNDGTMLSKQELIAFDEKDSNKYSTAENRNVKVRVYGNDFAVSTGDYHVTGFDQNGKEFDRIARFTNVWVRRNGSWQVVAGHNTWLPTKQ